MADRLIKTLTAQELLSQNTVESRQVFGKYIYEGELGILFGDSNTGKSILANDIAFFVSGGGHEWTDMVSPKINTMYIDMEMTTSQFAQRYRDAADYIPSGYCRSEVNVLMSAEDKIFTAIKTEILLQQKSDYPPKFIIIDNITNGFGSIFSASKMRGLISELKMLKDRFGLTILLIAHCPKRKPNTPITDNSLGGSKMLINFCDSAFAIAPSQFDSSMKYIKQIKTRVGEKLTDVMTVQISNTPYLHMEYLNMCTEDAHINPQNDDLRNTIISPEIEIELVKMIEGGYLSATQIASMLGIKKDVVVDYMLNHFA